MSTSPAETRPRPATRWVRGWGHVVLLVLNLLTGVVAAIVAVAVLAGAIGLLGALLGLVVLVPALWAAWAFAGLERRRIEAFTGTHIVPPPPTPVRTWRRRLGLTPEHGRAVGYTALHTLWGLLSGAVVTAWLAGALGLLVLPLVAGPIPAEGLDLLYGVLQVRSPGTLPWFALAGLVLLVLLPLAAPRLSAVDVHLARWLLGADPDRELAELTERVDTLTETRVAAVDSVEAERRRIERDLHDGPQQRLVAIAMDLGMARTRLATDPDGIGDLLDRAHAASKDAIVVMRQVARGITPPILADRGLDAALSALAAGSPVPVEVDAEGVGRLDPTLEAIAYFSVSEALTNVAKHAGATGCRVTVSRHAEPAELVVEIVDDGVGGADPLGGTGLTGLRQRVGAVDGTLDIHSPADGGTRLVVTLPDRGRTS